MYYTFGRFDQWNNRCRFYFRGIGEIKRVSSLASPKPVFVAIARRIKRSSIDFAGTGRLRSRFDFQFLSRRTSASTPLRSDDF